MYLAGYVLMDSTEIIVDWQHGTAVSQRLFARDGDLSLPASEDVH